jgi:SAM-dependent methyltransferase
MSQTGHANNQRTVEGYERCARDYAAEVDSTPSPTGAAALRQLVAAVAPGKRVLEIGSGPGWDADFLETLGIDVHRTDVTSAFCDFQAERGKRCDALDLLVDPIAGRYDGIAMLAVLQHFERTQLDAVLRKLAQALGAGGPLLLMYPEGDGEHWEGDASGDFRLVRWTPEAMDARLAWAGFAVAWEQSFDGRAGSWRSVLARRQA